MNGGHKFKECAQGLEPGMGEYWVGGDPFLRFKPFFGGGIKKGGGKDFCGQG